MLHEQAARVLAAPFINSTGTSSHLSLVLALLWPDKRRSCTASARLCTKLDDKDTDKGCHCSQSAVQAIHGHSTGIQIGQELSLCLVGCTYHADMKCGWPCVPQHAALQQATQHATGVNTRGALCSAMQAGCFAANGSSLWAACQNCATSQTSARKGMRTLLEVSMFDSLTAHVGIA